MLCELSVFQTEGALRNNLHDLFSLCSSVRGKVKETVVPFKRVDSRETEPPCASIIPLTTYSPRPVPCSASFWEEFTWENLENKFF